MIKLKKNKTMTNLISLNCENKTQKLKLFKKKLKNLIYYKTQKLNDNKTKKMEV